jgi:eukaryotic-like serine/threonine-protein kinase
MAIAGARSRKLVAQRPAAWAASRSDEEARAYLESRLAVLSKALFWSFLALVAFLFAMYKAYPTVEPRYQKAVDLVAAGALAQLAIVWRVLLLRRRLPLHRLYDIDQYITIGSGFTFALVAVIAYDLPASAYTCLIYESFTIFTRALLVPSSARRTAIVSALAMAPLVVGSVLLAVITEDHGGVPDAAIIAGAILYCAVAVLLATTGSRIIYDLRQRVTAAMQLGSYTLGHKIGEGGIGTVYIAHHAMLRRPTAVKLLQPDRVGAENLDRFEREVQHMSQLTHPNTVAVFDYGRSPDGVLYYAMEYLAGIDLELLVKKHGPQPIGRVVQVLAQVCGALQEAHDAGIIHRDIKPGNIIMCERGGVPDVAKVVDFGLVKEITAPTGQSTQLVVGTPAYVAPEAVTDPDRVGPASDLYALGAVGYFLLTGRRVFQGKTAFDVCMQHVSTPPTPPSALGVTVPPELEAILMRCLAKQPPERFASAAALADALAALPPARDWSTADARQWWREFRAQQPQPVSGDTPTLTITVDLDQR